MRTPPLITVSYSNELLLYSLEAVCVHCKMLHRDEWMLYSLRGSVPEAGVKVQQAGQQLHKLHDIQMILYAQFVAMITMVGVRNTVHRWKYKFPCLLWFDI